MSLPNKTGNIFRVFFVDYHTMAYYPWYHTDTLNYMIVNQVANNRVLICTGHLSQIKRTFYRLLQKYRNHFSYNYS